MCLWPCPHHGGFVRSREAEPAAQTQSLCNAQLSQKALDRAPSVNFIHLSCCLFKVLLQCLCSRGVSSVVFVFFVLVMISFPFFFFPPGHSPASSSLPFIVAFSSSPCCSCVFVLSVSCTRPYTSQCSSPTAMQPVLRTLLHSCLRT